MEASLNGCGKLLDKINALHTTFAEQPEAEYEGHGKKKAAYSLQIENSIFSVHLVLNWLNLPELRDIELERIARESVDSLDRKRCSRKTHDTKRIQSA